MKMDFILSNTENSAMQIALSLLAKKSRENLFEDYIVIVPETKTLFAERCLLDNISSGAFTNIYIYSFNRLLKKIQTSKKIPLSKQAGVMIVRSLIMQNQDNLVCYKKTSKTAGFAENIFNTIQQLKSSGVCPSELYEASEKVSSALKIKLKDIALIYNEYESYIGENLIDPNDKLEMLEVEANNSDFIKNSHVYILGFDSITSNMEGVVRGFVKNAKSVTLSASFMHSDKKNAHISDNEVFSRYKKIADSLKIAYQSNYYETKLNADMEHIKNALYCYPTQKQMLNGNLTIFGAPSLKEECAKVASLIKQSVLKKTRRYKDIYCFVADESCIDFLVSELQNFEIPYFVSEPYQEENHQFYHFIKSIFALAKRNLDSTEVINFARNNLLFLDSDKVDDFENYVLKFGTNYTKFLKPFEYGKDNEQMLKNAEEVRKYLVDVFFDFCESLSGDKNTGEIVLALFEFFDKFNMQEKLEKLSVIEEELGETREAFATKQVFEKATNVLEMLAKFLDKEKLSLDEFYTLLISGLESSDISLLPLGVDQVQIVLSPDAVYKAKDLYIIGATDGVFPKRELDLGLISDNEIASLEGINQKKIEPTIKTINRRERFSAYELLQVPSDNLIISFSDHLVSGEESKMSSMVQLLSALFIDEEGNNIEIKKYYNVFDDENFENLVYSLGSKKNAMKYFAESVSKFKNGNEENLDNLGIIFKAVKDGFDEENIKNINNIYNSDAYEVLQNAKDLYFVNNTTSISELESYFSCPFKHFVNYGLRLKERELSSMKSLDVGNIMHAVAEMFMNFAVQNSNVDVDKFAKNSLKKVLSEEKYSEEDNRILIKILEGEVVRLCRALFEEMKSSNFKTVLTESWFGKNGKFDGINIHQNPKVDIVGKIDRIDKAILENGQNYYRIIDYKTGKIESNPSDIYYGKKLQLAIYLDAISNDKVKPAGVLYFPIHNDFAPSKEKADDAYKCKGFILSDKNVILKMDNTLSLENPKSKYIFAEVKTNKASLKSGEIEFKSNSSLISEEEIKSISSYAKLISKKAVDEILQGYIKPTPLKTSEGLACEYCEFRNICGIMREEDKWIREANSPLSKDFYKGGKKWEN